jgi:hypothetical protein
MGRDITFTKGQGGLARALPGEDHISGMVFFSATAPSGMALDTVQVVYSLADAVALGITTSVAALAVANYHISEFFRLCPGATLYVGVFTTPASTYDWSQLTTIQKQYANGKIRQCFVYAPALTFALAQVTAIDTVTDALETAHMPMTVLYQPNINQTVTTLNTGTTYDLTTLTTVQQTAVVLGEDGGNVGKGYRTTYSYSIGCGGALLGLIARSNVGDSIEWVENNNIAESGEYDVPALSNGALVSAQSQAALDALYAKNYVFLQKITGIAGTYVAKSAIATASTSDYAFIENIRTAQKAMRNIYTNTVGYLSGRLTFNADNTMSAATVAYIEELIGKPLRNMVSANNISGYTVFIDPAQKPKVTNTVTASVALNVNGVMRNLNINLKLS